MENANTEPKPRIAIVKAFPLAPHKRRWCGLEVWIEDKRTGNDRRPSIDGDGRPRKHGLPWPDFDVKVAIVDNPKPFDPDANGGVPSEISPRTLRMLEQDHRISVHVLGEGDSITDPAEAVRTKAQLIDAEEAVQKARRELSEAAERAKADHQKYEFVLSSTEKRAIDATAKVTALEAEIESLRAQLADKKGGKK